MHPLQLAGTSCLSLAAYRKPKKARPSVEFCRCMFCGPPTAACDLQGHEGEKEFDILRICDAALLGMWIMDQLPSMLGQLADYGME